MSKIWFKTNSKHAANIIWRVYRMRNKCLLLPTACTFQSPTDPKTNSAVFPCIQCLFRLLLDPWFIQDGLRLWAFQIEGFNLDLRASAKREAELTSSWENSIKNWVSRKWTKKYSKKNSKKLPHSKKYSKKEMHSLKYSKKYFRFSL